MKAATQNLNNIVDNDFFVFAHENIFDFDNSINSLVGCCSFGTGHVESFIGFIMGNLNYRHCSRMIQDHRIFLFLAGKYL